MNNNNFDKIIKGKLDDLIQTTHSKADINRVLGHLSSNASWTNKLVKFFSRFTLPQFIGAIIIVTIISSSLYKNENVEGDLRSYDGQHTIAKHQSINESVQNKIIEDVSINSIEPKAYLPKGKIKEIVKSNLNESNLLENKNTFIVPKVKKTEIEQDLSFNAHNPIRDELIASKMEPDNVYNKTGIINLNSSQTNDGVILSPNKNIGLLSTISTSAIVSLNNDKLDFLNKLRSHMHLSKPFEAVKSFSPHRFSIGVSLGVADDKISFGLLAGYNIHKRFTFYFGLNYVLTKEERFENEKSFHDNRKSVFTDTYAPHQEKNDINNIRIVEYSLELPISLQYRHPIYRNIYLIGSGGITLNLNKTDKGSYQLENNTDQISFSKVNHTFSINSLDAGLGAQLDYQNWGFQILPQLQIPIKSDLNLENGHHFDHYFKLEGRLVHRF